MRKTFTILSGSSILLFILIVSALSLSTPAETVEGDKRQDQKTVAGKWLGTLEAQGVTLHLGLKVTKAADGKFSATFDSIDQGASDLPVDSITQEKDKVHFEINQYGVIYDGTLNEQATEISGDFKQGGGTYPLVFKRSE